MVATKDDGREWFERISRKSPTAEHDGFRKRAWEIIMFSEIRKLSPRVLFQNGIGGWGASHLLQMCGSPTSDPILEQRVAYLPVWLVGLDFTKLSRPSSEGQS